MSEKILETEGVLGDVNLSELPLYFIPLEEDVMSLGLDESFSHLYLVSRYVGTYVNIFSYYVSLIHDSTKTLLRSSFQLVR